MGVHLKRGKTIVALIDEHNSARFSSQHYRQNTGEMINDTLAEQLEKRIRQAGINRSALAAEAWLDRYYIL